MKKVVIIMLAQRDENGNLTGNSLSMEGETYDEGQSVELKLGFLPGADTALPGDIQAEYYTVTATPIPHTQQVVREIFEPSPGAEPKQRLWFVDPPEQPAE